MGKVIFDTSMSLDGFMTAANQTAEQPLGDNGERLHEWAFGDDERNRALIANAIGSLGAVICGRKTYDDSLPWWDADGPTGDARLPVFVVTHNAPETSPENGVYTFATDGLEDALAQARAAAGDKDVSVMGGANLGSQFIAAGLVDEISIHLVPIMFGGGTKAFDPRDSQVELEIADVVSTPQATHLRFVVKR